MHEDTMSNQRLHVQWPSPQPFHLNPQLNPSRATYGNFQPQSIVPNYGDQGSQSSLPDGTKSASIPAEVVLTAARCQLPKSQLYWGLSSHHHGHIHEYKSSA